MGYPMTGWKPEYENEVVMELSAGGDKYRELIKSVPI